MPKIAIPIGNIDPIKLVNPNRISAQKEQHESLIDVLGRHLRY